MIQWSDLSNQLCWANWPSQSVHVFTHTGHRLNVWFVSRAAVVPASKVPPIASRTARSATFQFVPDPGRFSPSAFFLICRPPFAVQQLLASAVWAGACRSYLARQLGVIQPGTPTHQCHVLAPLVAQFCPHQKYSDYLRIILQIQQNPKWFPGIMGATTAQHRQNTKESIIRLTRPKLHASLRFSCSHMRPPPQSLHWYLCRPWWHIIWPPQGAHCISKRSWQPGI